MSATLYQIWYKPDHLKELYPFARPIENRGLTIFFENTVISDVVSRSEDEKIAVCSWKLGQKLRRAWPVTPETLGRDYEVLSFTRNGRDHRMLAMANVWHPDFMKSITLLWEKLGYKMPQEAKNPIYQNHFAAKSVHYKRYVSEFLNPAMKLISSDEELHALMTRSSNYSKRARSHDLKSVKEKLGMDEYPLCPFVLERCPSLWFQMNSISISYL